MKKTAMAFIAVNSEITKTPEGALFAFHIFTKTVLSCVKICWKKINSENYFIFRIAFAKARTE